VEIKESGSGVLNKGQRLLHCLSGEKTIQEDVIAFSVPDGNHFLGHETNRLTKKRAGSQCVFSGLKPLTSRL
jgi:hypothetical protein